MEMNQMAAPPAMTANPGRNLLGRSGAARIDIIRNIGSASAETGTGPTREKRLERTASQPEPPPQPGMAAPLRDFQRRMAAEMAAREESVAMVKGR